MCLQVAQVLLTTGEAWPLCTAVHKQNSLCTFISHRSFLPLEKRGRAALLFTSHELNALNARLRDAAHDCLVLAEKVLAVVKHGMWLCKLEP